MDLSGFMLGSGMALLIALLGWGNQIKDFHTETKRLELLLAKKIRSKYSDVKRLTNNLDIENIQQSFSEVLKSVKKITHKNEKNEAASLQVVNKLDIIERKYESIKNMYHKKYNLVVELSIICFSIGLVDLIFNSSIITLSNKFLVPYVVTILFVIWIVRIIRLLIILNKTEKAFQRRITDIDELLEG